MRGLLTEEFKDRQGEKRVDMENPRLIVRSHTECRKAANYILCIKLPPCGNHCPILSSFLNHLEVPWVHGNVPSHADGHADAPGVGVALVRSPCRARARDVHESHVRGVHVHGGDRRSVPVLRPLASPSWMKQRPTTPCSNGTRIVLLEAS